MTTCTCDICNNEIYTRNNEKELKEFKTRHMVQYIIKYSDRVPSRSINHEMLDVCHDCIKRIYDGCPIWSYEKDKYTFDKI